MPSLLGSQQPRVELVPEGVEHPDSDAAAELVQASGVILDPWQAMVFRGCCLQDPVTRKWAAFRAGINCPRQNGKNEIILALELAALFIFGDRLVVHSAHLVDTSLEAFRRLRGVIEDNDWLHREVEAIRAANGQEGIELKNGQRIRFRTRTKGGGRGFTGDRLFFDEAMDIHDSSHAALLPIVSARPNPQVIYAGSAVDQQIMEDGIVFARIREDAMRGEDPSLAYWEWSADYGSPEEVEDPTNAELWAQANPGLGIRISPEHVANEQRALSARGFAVERLGVGDWPRTDGLGEVVIGPDAWKALTDKQSTALDPITLGYDVSPDRRWSSITAAGRRKDGLYHAEVIDRRPGTSWVVERIVELHGKHKPAGVLCDAVSPAASLIHELEKHGVEVKALTAQEHARACGLLLDLVEHKKLRHLGDNHLLTAIKGAAKRTLVDAFAWTRRNSNVDITALCALTFAIWGADQFKPVYRPGSFT